MRDAERRLLRCIGWIDNELILEADQARFRPRRWGHWLALAACVAVVLSIPFLLPQKEKLALDIPAEQTQASNKGTAGTEDTEALLPELEEEYAEEPWDGMGDPPMVVELPYNLTSGELIHYEWRDKAWVQTRIIDKAAKHICITMTISDPEEAFKEKDGVSRWIDFCNGTAVELRGDDIASVYTYTGETFDPDKLDGLTWHLEGRYTGLDNAVEQSLANPTETWEEKAETMILPNPWAEQFDLSEQDAVLFDAAVAALNRTPDGDLCIPVVGIYGTYPVENGTVAVCSVQYHYYYGYSDPGSVMDEGGMHYVAKALLQTGENGALVCTSFELSHDGGSAYWVDDFCGPLTELKKGFSQGKFPDAVITMPSAEELAAVYFRDLEVTDRFEDTSESAPAEEPEEEP